MRIFIDDLVGFNVFKVVLFKFMIGVLVLIKSFNLKVILFYFFDFNFFFIC